MVKLINGIKVNVSDYLGDSPALSGDDLVKDMRDSLESLNIEDMILQIRQLYDNIDRTDGLIEKQKAAFESDDSDKEDIEAVYALKMDFLYHLAYGIHPLTSFGAKCISDAIAVRHEFEETVGVLTTRITARNIHIFMPVLTKDLAEDICTGRREAIGAIRTLEGERCGAGALVYHIDEAYGDDSDVIRIEWLYVHPSFRGRRIADNLLAEIVYQQKKTGMSAVACAFTVGDSWEPVIGGIFSKWKFMFSTQMEPDTIIDMGDIVDEGTILSFYKKVGKTATPISKLGAKNIPRFVAMQLSQNGYRGYLWGQLRTPGFFDPDLSCYVGDAKAPKGVMLVHRTPSGLLRVEYIGLGASDMLPIEIMIGYLLGQAFNPALSVSRISIPVQMDELDELLSKLVPQQRSDLLVTAVLSDDLLTDDITEDELRAVL